MKKKYLFTAILVVAFIFLILIKYLKKKQQPFYIIKIQSNYYIRYKALIDLVNKHYKQDPK